MKPIVKDIHINTSYGVLTIDVFYVIALVACVILFLVLPGKRADIVAAGVIVFAIGMADMVASFFDNDN